MHIAYAPAAYYRPWRAVYAGASSAQQRWLNTALIRQRRLPMPASLETPADLLARRVIGLWPRLPQVATLMAAARLREWLPSQRACSGLPATVQAFLRAGHGRPGAVVPPGATAASLPDVLLLWGGAQLQPVSPMLPAWLSARLCLSFAPLSAEEARPPQCERADMDLFWSAVTYVEKLS
jgi:hypothetical protein